MTGSDELCRENRALRERAPALNAAILQTSASLDLDTVLRETAESARGLTGARRAQRADPDQRQSDPG